MLVASLPAVLWPPVCLAASLLSPAQVIQCANTPDEHAELRAAGVRCILFNHNAALDERTFRPTGMLWCT